MDQRVATDLVKQGEESFGVQLSFQYKKALEEQGKSLSVCDIAQKIQMRKMGTASEQITPSLPIKTIPLTSKFEKQDLQSQEKSVAVRLKKK